MACDQCNYGGAWFGVVSANNTFGGTVYGPYSSNSPVIASVPGKVACHLKKVDTIPTRVVAGMRVVDARLSLVELTVAYKTGGGKFNLRPGDSVYVYANALAGQGWPKEVLTIDGTSEFMMVPEDQVYMTKTQPFAAPLPYCQATDSK